MAEMSKEMKIVMIVNVIVSFIYTFFHLIIPEIYYQLTDAPVFDIHYWRLFGGSLLVLGIVGIIAVIRAEWEHVKITFEIATFYLIMVFILNIVTFITITSSVSYFVSQLIATILCFILIVLNIYFYLREQKRT